MIRNVFGVFALVLLIGSISSAGNVGPWQEGLWVWKVSLTEEQVMTVNRGSYIEFDGEKDFYIITFLKAKSENEQGPGGNYFTEPMPFFVGAEGQLENKKAFSVLSSEQIVKSVRYKREFFADGSASKALGNEIWVGNENRDFGKSANPVTLVLTFDKRVVGQRGSDGRELSGFSLRSHSLQDRFDREGVLMAGARIRSRLNSSDPLVLETSSSQMVKVAHFSIRDLMEGSGGSNGTLNDESIVQRIRAEIESEIIDEVRSQVRIEFNAERYKVAGKMALMNKKLQKLRSKKSRSNRVRKKIQKVERELSPYQAEMKRILRDEEQMFQARLSERVSSLLPQRLEQVESVEQDTSIAGEQVLTALENRDFRSLKALLGL